MRLVRTVIVLSLLSAAELHQLSTYLCAEVLEGGDTVIVRAGFALTLSRA